MVCETGRCKTSTPKGIFIVPPSLEGWPTKAKEALSPHEIRLSPLDTNPVFQCLGTETTCLLIQLASMNVFYSEWLLEDFYFYKSLLLLWGFYQILCCSLLSNTSFGKVCFLHYLHNDRTILIPKFQRSYVIPEIFLINFVINNAFYNAPPFCGLCFAFFLKWILLKKAQDLAGSIFSNVLTNSKVRERITEQVVGL